MTGTQGPTSFRLVLAFLLVLILALLAWLLWQSGSGQEPKSAAEEVSFNLPAPAALPESIGPERTLATAPTTAEEVAAVSAAEAAPAPETRIFGTLLNPALEPIRGAWYAGVSLTDQAGYRRYSEVDPNGDYSFTSLGFGKYWLHGGAEGFRRQSVEIELTPEAPEVRKDFIFQQSVMLRIRLVTPEGGNVFEALRELKSPQGAFGMIPVATRENPGPRFVGLAGSQNEQFGAGNFWDYGPRVDRLPPGYFGILVLDGDLPAWVSLVQYQRVLQSQLVEPGQEEVTIVVSPEELLAGLTGVRLQLVEAENGLPIPEGSAYLVGGTSDYPAVTTDADGRGILDGLEPGRFELFIQAAGYERYFGLVDAEPGVMTDLGTIELEREVTVAGLVFDSENRPQAQEFTLGLVNATTGSIRWLRNETFRSKADGSFQMRGLGRHEYVIRSSNQADRNPRNPPGIVWVSGIVSCDTRSGSLSALDIRLRPASSLVVQVADGLGDGMRFRVLDESGRELLASRFYGAEPRPLSLPPGKYRVVLLDSSGNPLSESSATLGTETVHLELDPLPLPR